MRVFDTHAHYDSGAFNGDRLELLASLPVPDPREQRAHREQLHALLAQG